MQKLIFLLCFIAIMPANNFCYAEAGNKTITWGVMNSTPVSTQADGQNNTAVLVDLDLKDVDIRDVVRSFSKISGKNIIVSEEVKAKVTLRLKNVGWREALDMTLGTYNFVMVEKDNYIVISTLEKRRQAEERGELETRIVTFNFVKVSDIQKTLSSMLTSRGKIEVDARTNSLVITDIVDRIDRIRDVAVQLDTKTPQVMIEAMLIDLKLTNEEQLGINWTMTLKEMSQRSMIQNLGLSGATTGEIRYGKTIMPWADFTAVMNFWIEQKRVNILANPKVLTLDNLAANIDINEQIPYTQQTTTDQGTVASTQFKDVGIKLSVVPHITKDNFIFLNIKTEQSFRSGWTPDNQPIIDSRKAETNLMVKDGETIVIGGLRKKEDTVTTDKLPILGSIPYLGKLFNRSNRSKIESELVIFVTPRVSVSAVLDEYEKTQVSQFEAMKKKDPAILRDKKEPFGLRSPPAK
ncbi:MAG: secretin N-terminal domain-containing protein [Candidatus Omnitrophota bacterium]